MLGKRSEDFARIRSEDFARKRSEDFAPIRSEDFFRLEMLGKRSEDSEQDAPRCPKMAPWWPQDAPRCSKMAPRQHTHIKQQHESTRYTTQEQKKGIPPTTVHQKGWRNARSDWIRPLPSFSLGLGRVELPWEQRLFSYFRLTYLVRIEF